MFIEECDFANKKNPFSKRQKSRVLKIFDRKK